jgi:hypothetical protein
LIGGGDDDDWGSSNLASHHQLFFGLSSLDHSNYPMRIYVLKHHYFKILVSDYENDGFIDGYTYS